MYRTHNAFTSYIRNTKTKKKKKEKRGKNDNTETTETKCKDGKRYNFILLASLSSLRIIHISAQLRLATFPFFYCAVKYALHSGEFL